MLPLAPPAMFGPPSTPKISILAVFSAQGTTIAALRLDMPSQLPLDVICCQLCDGGHARLPQGSDIKPKGEFKRKRRLEAVGRAKGFVFLNGAAVVF